MPEPIPTPAPVDLDLPNSRTGEGIHVIGLDPARYLGAVVSMTVRADVDGVAHLDDSTAVALAGALLAQVWAHRRMPSDEFRTVMIRLGVDITNDDYLRATRMDPITYALAYVLRQAAERADLINGATAQDLHDAADYVGRQADRVGIMASGSRAEQGKLVYLADRLERAAQRAEGLMRPPAQSAAEAVALAGGVSRQQVADLLGDPHGSEDQRERQEYPPPVEGDRLADRGLDKPR